MSLTSKIHDFDDMRSLARRKLPRGLFEFIDRGAGQDIAVRGNAEAFDRIRLAPILLRDVSKLSTEATILGKQHAMPLAIAPTGAAGLTCFRGEIALARAAKAANVPFSLATRSMSSIEQIAAEAGGTMWFQLYPSKDQKQSEQLLDRAARNGFEALIVTIDSAIPPHRPYNERNGFSVAFKANPRAISDMLLHPAWFAGVIGRYLMNGGLPRFENLPGRPSVGGKSSPPSAILDGSLSWEMVRDLRRRWPHKLIVKGVLSVTDAKLAAACGADAIVVSNHGGRNLDMSPAPIEVLPRIVDAVGGNLPILLDGGVRRGSDIAKALVLGASAVLVGRATLFSVAAGGEAAARHMLGILKHELYTTMGLLGCGSIDTLTRELLFENDEPARQAQEPRRVSTEMHGSEN